MTDSLAVLIGSETAGTITRLAGGRLEFRYEPGYVSRDEATPLSVSMPVSSAVYPDQAITPWLWGLLPDDPAVIARWARHYDLTRSSPFTLMATPIGADCAGAVQFARPDDLQRVRSRPGTVTWLSEEDVAERLENLRVNPANWLGATFEGRFSLAGAQAKTALVYQEGRWGIPSGAMPTTHILKPAIPGLADHDLNEHLCLSAARRAGMVTAATALAHFGDETAIVIGRYDRYRDGDRLIRVHQEDLCQALGVAPTKKYQNEGGPAPRDIAAALRRVIPGPGSEQAVRRFADALIWNWLVGGTDGHAKNYSLLLQGAAAMLAPLYDIASALPYGDHEKALRLAMKIGGDYRLDWYRNRWPACARELALDPDELMARVRELVEIAPDAFAEESKDPDVADLGSSLPARLTDLIADRCRRCEQALDFPVAP